MLEMLDFTIRIGITPTFLYFDLYLSSAYAAHYVYFVYYGHVTTKIWSWWKRLNYEQCSANYWYFVLKP